MDVRRGSSWWAARGGHAAVVFTLAASLLSGVGCSERTPPGGGAGAGVDAAPAPRDAGRRDASDAAPPPPDVSVRWDVGPCVAASVGTFCKRDGDCGPGTRCAITSQERGEGICTCLCTPDDVGTTAVDEDTCPAGLRCASVYSGVSLLRSICVKPCTPRSGKNECAAGIACDPTARISVPGRFGQYVCYSPGCRTDTDCPVLTEKPCNTSSPRCPAGQSCVAVGATAGTANGRCAMPGACDRASGLCVGRRRRKGTYRAGARVGDPCRSDLDCGPTMLCLLERKRSSPPYKERGPCTSGAECCSWVCEKGQCRPGRCWDYAPNGMCISTGCRAAATVPDFACPSDGVCSLRLTGGVCLRSCSLSDASSCRGHKGDIYGDYECRDWTGLGYRIRGRWEPIARKPVCEQGLAVPCSYFKGGSLSCRNLGGTGGFGGGTMRCRDPLTSKQLPRPDDPMGFCLDATGSGPVKRP